jgi:hypothetical protein
MVIKKKPKQKPITTIEMEVAIAKMFGIRQHIIVPNLSWGLIGMHECDLFLIKKSGVAVEVEIKRSKSDFLADFKKGHDHKDRLHRITEFYYAFPENLVEKCIDLVPEHAGVIVCQRWVDYKKQQKVSAHIKKQPKRIKGARKLTEEEQLKVARLGTMRIWTLKEKIIKNG